ncbi:MAG: hypothetical protein ACRBB6_04390 [Neptuniibacter sp.]
MRTLDNLTKAELDEELLNANKVLKLLSPPEHYIDAREPYEQRINDINSYLKQYEMLELIGAGDPNESNPDGGSD